MTVKTKIPWEIPDIRGYVALRLIRKKAIAKAYGCRQSWISMVLNGDRVASADVLRRLREAITKVEEERCQRQAAS